MGVRLIAEPWEGNQKCPNYQLGSAIGKPHFSGTDWRQWTDRFRRTVRCFIKSDDGVLADFVSRIYGSSDLFPDSLEEACHPDQSINYIDAHDGPTLYDLVAYTGSESWNCGDHDGEAGVTLTTMRLRKRQIKNFCCVLMLSNGTPMFRAGDEFLRTQHGKTNPYDVDGPLTWIDWSRRDLHHDIFRFFSKMIQFRKDHPSIGRSTFWRDDVSWYGVTGAIDFSTSSHAVAYCLRGGSHQDDDLYVMINAFWQPLRFEIQEGHDWRIIVDTSLEAPHDFVENAQAAAVTAPYCLVEGRSIVVFIRNSAASGSLVCELQEGG
jgi:glycogen operon protein